MSFTFAGWLNHYKAKFHGSRRKQRRSPIRTIRSTRLNVEQMEDRVVPSTLTSGALTPMVATEGVGFINQTVFHFTDSNLNSTVSDYTATVNTGDATLTSAANPNNVHIAASGNGFDVQLSYQYAEELSGGTFSVQVTDSGGDSTSASTSSPGNNLNGAYAPGYTLGAAGALTGDAAVVLDGTTGHVNVPATTLNNLAAGTIEAWINLNANTNETIFAKQDNNINSYGIFSVGYQSPVGGGTPGHLYFQGHDYVPVAVSAGTVPIGSYHYVAAAFSTAAVTFYIDGVLDSSTSGDYSIGNDTNATTMTSIGAWLGDGAGHYLNGSIDELATYPSALSASQIAAHYHAASSGLAAYQAAVLGNTPTAYYHLNETSGTVAHDSSVGANTFSVADAALTATATPVTTAVYGTAFSGEVAAFTDANPASTSADFPLANVAINWGDANPSTATSVTEVGTTFHVFGSHTYGAAGATVNPLIVTITDLGGSVATTTGYMPMVAKAHLSVTADSISRLYGAVDVFTATITGFRNQETSSVVSGTASLISTDTAMSAPGTYTITAALGSLAATNYDFNTFNAGTLTITAAPLSAAGLTFTPTAGAPFSGVVASYINADPAGTPAAYTAQITWGDGGTSVGTITDNGGAFVVSGSHTYALAGTDAVSVVINHKLGYTTTATAYSSAVVTNLGFGQTQDLDFWHKSAGQNLINNFNGGPNATALSSWLATTYTKLYGGQAGGNNLLGKTNVQVSAFFQSLWSQHHVGVDVQTLSAALNVYASTLSLGGVAGETAGFQVTTQGLGGSSYNVGTRGAAFGVANNTTLTVSQMLVAVNSQAANGVLYSGNPSLRDLAEDMLDKVNREGHAGILDDQTRTVSFWHGDGGQDLITAFNRNANATALSSWLATSFPKLYGSGAGANDLTGKNNTQVAAFFQSLWANHHDETDVQVLALALNVYASTQSLGGIAGQSAGFTVTAMGLGASSFSLGNSGAVAGVANNSTINVYDLLVAVNNEAVNGVMYGGDARSLDLCEDLCERLNGAGR